MPIKGIPFFGKTPDNKAKIPNVNAAGDLQVALSGTIASTKFFRISSSLVAAGTSYTTVFETEKETVLHNLTAIFQKDEAGFGFSFSFWNGIAWEFYTRFTDFATFDTEIRPGNVGNCSLFEAQENTVKLRISDLNIAGLRIQVRNTTASDARVGLNFVYSQIN